MNSCEKKNILIIFPHGNALNKRSGAETRVFNLINSLVDHNLCVKILHSNNSKSNEDLNLKRKCEVFYYKELTYFGIPDSHFIDINPFFLFKLYQITRKKKLDIIQLEFPWGFLATKILSKRNTFLIYDSHGVEAEFIKVSMKNPKFPKTFKPIAIFLAKIYERLVCKLSNLIISVSEFDRTYYVKNYKIDKSKTFLLPIPSSIKSNNEIAHIKDFKLIYRKKLGLPINKKNVIFHGSLPHPPNKEAFNLIINYIAPNIRNPNILFVLAGQNLKKFEMDNIISLGFVKDLKTLLYSADFAIIPIISGSGQRVKCSDYITANLPFIATKKGVQGIEFLKSGEDFLLFDTVNNNFLEGINLLNDSDILYQKFHKNLKNKSKRINSKKIGERYFKLLIKLINHN